MEILRSRLTLIITLFLSSLFMSSAYAQSGFYVGGSLGNAAVDADFGDSDSGVFDLDEDEFGWKAYGGYLWDLAALDLAVEGGYVDFGSPATSIENVRIELDTNSWNIWGIAGIDIGPIGIFGKLGYIAWDVDGSSFGDFDDSVSGDGSDLGYGIGIKWMFGESFELRGEYERYDVDDLDNLDMLSIGLAWHF